MILCCMHNYYHNCIHIVTCSGGTLAYASYCMLDISDNNRPVAGYINICPSVSCYAINYVFV